MSLKPWEIEHVERVQTLAEMLDNAGYEIRCKSVEADLSPDYAATKGRLVARVAVAKKYGGPELYSTEYHYPNNALRQYGPINRRTKDAIRWKIEGGKNKPEPVDVLGSLLSDASLALGCTHEDFCMNLGIDTDSRKGLESYLTCQRTLEVMRAVFRDKLGEAVELASQL